MPFGKDSDLFSRHIDYLADAIDDLENKYLLIRECLERKISFVSAMGMARKLDWRKIAVMKLAETSYDPLARMLRRRLRDDGLSLDFPVVSSTEKPLPTAGLGSYMPVTSIAGIVMADHIIKKVISETTWRKYVLSSLLATSPDHRGRGDRLSHRFLSEREDEAEKNRSICRKNASSARRKPAF